MQGIYELRRWGGLRWHDLHTKFHDDWIWHSSNTKVITSKISEDAVLVLVMKAISEVRSCEGLDITCTPSFINFSSGDLNLLGTGVQTYTQRQQNYLISRLFYFFKLRKWGWNLDPRGTWTLKERIVILFKTVVLVSTLTDIKDIQNNFPVHFNGTFMQQHLMNFKHE
jgi:hypothetical protein